MEEKQKRVTIYDIAKEANVSRQTVSRVLNNAESIRPKTRERILKVMREMNYRPDPLARGLALNRSHVIGVLSASFTGYNYSRILEGAESRASELEFQTLISRTYTNTDLDREPENYKVFENQRIEGLFIIYNGSTHDNFQLLHQISPTIPIVSIGYASENPRVTSIQFDNVGGAKLAVEHLLKQGRRKILNLCGPRCYTEVNQRTEGYSQMIAAYGIEEDPQLTTYSDSWNVKDGGKQVELSIKNGITFDSIFAHSDLLALGAIHALREKGLKVPEDIPIIGFDDIPISEFLETPLTTIHRPNFNLGRTAMDKLINLIKIENDLTVPSLNDKQIIEDEDLVPYLVVRTSCP